MGGIVFVDSERGEVCDEVNSCPNEYPTGDDGMD